MCQILLQAVAHINKGNSQKFNEDNRSVNLFLNHQTCVSSVHLYLLTENLLIYLKYQHLSYLCV